MKNWKTTLTGVLFAVINVAIPMLGPGGMAAVTLKDVAYSCGIAALGVLAKDFNVTGGTIDSGSSGDIGNRRVSARVSRAATPPATVTAATGTAITANKT